MAVPTAVWVATITLQALGMGLQAYGATKDPPPTEAEKIERERYERRKRIARKRDNRDPARMNASRNIIRSLEEQARSRPERESRNRIQHSATVDGAVNGQPTAVDTAENMATKPIAGGNTIKDRLMAGGS